MKVIDLTVTFTILAVASTLGKSGGISVLDGIQNADVIARVRIDDDLEVLPRYASSQSLREYRNLATASIIETFRAPRGVDKIKIQHMNGLICPNVIYTKGCEYIVFLQKAVDSDSYVTMGTNSGQFRIEDNQVARFVLMPGYKYSKDLKIPYERVSEFLRNAIQKKKS